jgi:hypothetical protein
LRPALKTSLGSVARRTLTLAIGCLGLAWGVFALPRSEALGYLQDLESHLLHSEAFSQKAMTLTLESQAFQRLSACDTHSQRAMLLMEMPLAEAALRSGAVSEFDQRIQSLETRSRRILTCSPRDSFVWLLAFDLEVLHGRLNEQSFKVLATSYETSPNEAWLSIRRLNVAMPLVLIAPDLVRKKILYEFQQLIRNGFLEEAARSFVNATGPVRTLLQTQVQELNPPRQEAFTAALQKLRSQASPAQVLPRPGKLLPFSTSIFEQP